MATKIVLACRHMRSLRLLCTAGGNQARSDARSEFEILERSPKGGGEAGRAHSCRSAPSRRDFRRSSRKLAFLRRPPCFADGGAVVLWGLSVREMGFRCRIALLGGFGL